VSWPALARAKPQAWRKRVAHASGRRAHLRRCGAGKRATPCGSRRLPASWRCATPAGRAEGAADSESNTICGPDDASPGATVPCAWAIIDDTRAGGSVRCNFGYRIGPRLSALAVPCAHTPAMHCAQAGRSAVSAPWTDPRRLRKGALMRVRREAVPPMRGHPSRPRAGLRRSGRAMPPACCARSLPGTCPALGHETAFGKTSESRARSISSAVIRPAASNRRRIATGGGICRSPPAHFSIDRR
jgi:hypothetical protein